jgi:kynurenine formamidase
MARYDEFDQGVNDVIKSSRSGIVAILAAMPALAVAQVSPREVRDLTLTVAADLPCVWPAGMTPFAVVPTKTIGLGPYHRDMLIIDEHTGTQWDAPAHFVPPPDSGLPGAGPNGLITGEKIPAWQFCGEACVIDVTAHRDDAPAGSSFLIGPDVVKTWEREHRPLRFGDAVLFRSDYTDQYYKPFPAGDRFVASVLAKKAPGWPAPTPETMAYLADKGVMTLGLDGASMGPVPDLAVATHQAGGKRGLIWTECATNLGSLPTTGAFYAQLPAKHAGGSGGECRCLAIVEPKLAARLIESARNKRVADLSVTLDESYPVVWPGYSAGEEGGRYLSKTLNAFGPTRGPFFAMTHLFDSYVGTHAVLPGYALPGDGFDNAKYSDNIRASLRRYEAKYGARGTSSLATEAAGLERFMGEARIIDVRSLVESTKEGDWPASPKITVERIRESEASAGPIHAGDVVIFESGYTDAHFKPIPSLPGLDRLFAAPLAGKAEGWPAPTPEAIAYLAEKGVRCIGTDGPTLGGVDRENALHVDWLTGSRGLFAVEMLTNLSAIRGKSAFFIFAPIKIKGTRGGYGRAIALY